MGENERHGALIASNSTLRSALIRARHQVSHLRTAMADLDQTLAAALGLPESRADEGVESVAVADCASESSVNLR